MRGIVKGPREPTVYSYQTQDVTLARSQNVIMEIKEAKSNDDEYHAPGLDSVLVTNPPEGDPQIQCDPSHNPSKLLSLKRRKKEQ